MLIEIKLPNISNDEFEVTNILVKIGENIKKKQSLLTIEGDKTSLEIPSDFSGIVKEIKINIGDKVKTDSLLFIIDNEKNEKINNIFKKKIVQENNIINEIYASPLIKSLSREFNIDLNKIKGTGLKGRITKEDIQLYINKKKNNKIYEDKKNDKNNIFIINKNIENIKLSNIQKISGKKLLKNWMTIPHVTIFDKIDITNLEKFRNKKNEEFLKKKKKVKITPLVFIIKAVAIVLNKMPKFNSILSKNNEYLKINKYINIGIAVETNKGLIVPVIKNIKNKNIIKISEELIDISNKARKGILNNNEISDSCFTISSLGHIGTKYFTPIINAPEVSILGISRSSVEPIWNNKEFKPKIMLPISLSFDHRAIDGADGARFIKKISYLLSDIRNIIM
ncbi:dihydrolipoyllysine-residue acetyltransferase [Enterobacterales bacterium endosymbiont of Anomoneura mori]|uniref:2-oxo acid dehydrogenase subunit E2 n=1 Tax=Enterobacterales bacterium endosymbiont of Anomoneura mori TaxID=3132096 RepID=UPI00399D0066